MKLVFSIFIFMCYKGKILPCVMLNTMIKRGASLVAQTVKNLPEMKETNVRSLGWEDPLEKGMPATPVFLSGESHGQRSL